MKQIQLKGTSGNGKFALVDDEDFDLVNQFDWYLNIRHHTNNASNVFSAVDHKFIIMHRLIMGCKKGDGKTVDHIDGNVLNNQKSNLRFCTQSQNQMNRVAKGSSKYKGVSWAVRKTKRITKKYGVRIDTQASWKANITVNGKQRVLGYFKSEEDAARIYNKYALAHFGEFARLNVIAS